MLHEIKVLLDGRWPEHVGGSDWKEPGACVWWGHIVHHRDGLGAPMPHTHDIASLMCSTHAYGTLNMATNLDKRRLSVLRIVSRDTGAQKRGTNSHWQARQL